MLQEGEENSEAESEQEDDTSDDKPRKRSGRSRSRVRKRYDSSSDSEEESEEEAPRRRTRRGKHRSRNHGRCTSRRQADQDWCGYQCLTCDDTNAEPALSMKQSGTRYSNLRNKLILDTGSTLQATIMNEDFITNIRTSTNPVVMATNAGTKKITLDGDLHGFGTAKYDPTQMATSWDFLI